MERADPANGVHPFTDESNISKPPKPRTALILYGSETGNAQDVAEEIGRLASRQHFDTTILDMDSISLRDLLTPTVILIAISTTGQGEMPQNARAFWKTLLSAALKPGILRRVRFASFGLGDSSYARFNVAHRMLCSRLLQLGAQMFCERGEGNEQHPEGHSAGLREWIVALQQKLLEVFPLPDGVEPLAEDVFLEPKWKLSVAESTDLTLASKESGSAGRSIGEGAKASDHVHAASGDTSTSTLPHTIAGDVPSTDLMPVKGAHLAHITANDRVTASDHFQDVRLMDLHLKDAIDYGPGAVAVIYPKNFPQDIKDFIALMEWQNDADKPLHLLPTNKNDTASTKTGHNPSPLRHLDLTTTTLTLRWLLENVLDIMSIPRRSFFASLAHFAASATEDEAYQKERLLELANPELIDELWDYTTRPKRTILEVMMDFTTIKIPWQYALSVLPMMKGRQFSIASGGHLRRTEDGGGGTRVQLLVAIADPPSPIIKWRRRYGVCTRYIAAVRAGESINIGMQEGYLDVRPSELDVPVVMIGPGTGLAPMRSMVWQRVFWSRDADSATHAKPLGEGLKGDILIFGCRNEHGDFFFRDEWELLRRSENLSVLVAFSRDRDKRREYVQDRIRAEGVRIRTALLEREGKVYVCGASGNMPKGVREALVDVLSSAEVKADVEMTREDAERYLDSMEKVGRYKQETW